MNLTLLYIFLAFIVSVAFSYYFLKEIVIEIVLGLAMIILIIEIAIQIIDFTYLGLVIIILSFLIYYIISKKRTQEYM